MEDFLTVANNVTSGLLVVVSWFLAHTYAAAGFPLGRCIAFLWGLLGLSVFTTAVFRVFEIPAGGLVIVTKIILIAIAVTITMRVEIRMRERSSRSLQKMARR